MAEIVEINITGVSNVLNRTKGIYNQRKAQVLAISNFYAAEAINYFRSQQLGSVQGKWWTNQTYQAAQTVFTQAFVDGDEIGWLIAHFQKYGIYLTLGNNRKNDALTPIINRFAPRFLEDVKKLYSDTP